MEEDTFLGHWSFLSVYNCFVYVKCNKHVILCSLPKIIQTIRLVYIHYFVVDDPDEANKKHICKFEPINTIQCICLLIDI